MSDEQRMVLRTEDLVKKYRTRTVVNHVSINVKQGEIVGLLGPNGAGKTTTFYMTVGLVTPNEGKIFLNDMEITKFPVYKRARNGIGYLAQEASIFRKMTVEDNIRSVLEMTGRSVEYQKEKLESLISEFGLEVHFPITRCKAPLNRNSSVIPAVTAITIRLARITQTLSLDNRIVVSCSARVSCARIHSSIGAINAGNSICLLSNPSKLITGENKNMQTKVRIQILPSVIFLTDR